MSHRLRSDVATASGRYEEPEDRPFAPFEGGDGSPDEGAYRGADRGRDRDRGRW
jgi:hypothetical protein